MPFGTDTHIDKLESCKAEVLQPSHPRITSQDVQHINFLQFCVHEAGELKLCHRSTYGGGATKALAGSLFLDNCQVANNTANAGAGTEIAGAAGYYTIVGISNSIISGNRAALQGGAFNLGSTNATTFSNVTFLDNIGRRLSSLAVGAAQPWKAYPPRCFNSNPSAS